MARLSWGGIGFRHVPIRCIYFPPGKRITHFRPMLDTARGVAVNAFLVFRRLAPLPFRRLSTQPAAAAPAFRPVVEVGLLAQMRWWRRCGPAHPTRNWRRPSHWAFSSCLTPFYLLQTILSIYFARRLHLNVLAAVIGSQVSIPPLAPLWVTLSYAVGHWVVEGQWTGGTFSKIEFSFRQLGPFLLGNLLVALTMSAVGLFTARAVLSFLRVEKPVRENRFQ